MVHSAQNSAIIMEVAKKESLEAMKTVLKIKVEKEVLVAIIKAEGNMEKSVDTIEITIPALFPQTQLFQQLLQIQLLYFEWTPILLSFIFS